MKKNLMILGTSLFLGLTLHSYVASAVEDSAKETEGIISFESGSLSIDYSSEFKFDTQKISTSDQVYYAKPDTMKVGTEKPTYVQVTDTRGTLAGWKLSLSQPEQFKTASGEELAGAQLKFTKAQVSSLVDGKYTPTNVTSEIELTPGQDNKMAINAKENTGIGTWIYQFGKDVADNKDAVQLFVPGSSTKLAEQYTTKLVWTLEDTPSN